MQKVDAHQHFWQYHPVRDSWITDDMQVLQNDFLPQQLAPVLQQNGFDGCVLVQSDQSIEGNEYMLQLAAENSFIKGMVAWVDLQADNVKEQLQYYWQQHSVIKGFRHVLQGEKDRALMLQPKFKKGIAALSEFGYTYDILIYPDQLIHTKELVAQFPQQPFIIDHIAKPDIKHQKIDNWKKAIVAVAQYPNVYCKISGMVTEADWKQWKYDDFIPYLDTIVAAFGTQRIVYGSDWPVCLVAGSYEQMLQMVQQYFGSFSEAEQQAFFGGNAIQFYNLQ